MLKGVDQTLSTWNLRSLCPVNLPSRVSRGNSSQRKSPGKSPKKQPTPKEKRTSMKRPAASVVVKRPAAPANAADLPEEVPQDAKTVDDGKAAEPEPEEEEEEENEPEPEEEEKDAKRKRTKKSEESKKSATIVSKTEFKGGWILYQMKTPKGRVYPKYVGPDGVRYNSLKTAKESGFKE